MKEFSNAVHGGARPRNALWGVLWRNFILIHLLRVGLAFSAEDETERLLEEGGTVKVIIGLKDTDLNPFSKTGQEFKGGSIKSEFLRTNAITKTIPVGEFAEYENDPNIEYIEIDSPAEQYAEETPWGITAVQADIPSIIIPLRDPNEDCFKICVIDSGLLVLHPDIPYSLGGTNIEGKEFALVNSQSRWYNPTAGATHGTHVAGTLLATGGNNDGVVGVIPNNQNVCLLVARVFDEPPNVKADTSDIDKAVEWCASSGAKVINMSLGSTSRSTNSEKIYQSLEADGILVVAAAGNKGSRVISYPAGYDSVMSVAAVDPNLVRSQFSQFNSKVDICAPGRNVLSTTSKVSIFDDGGRQYVGSLLEYSPVPPILSGVVLHCGLALTKDDCDGASGKICLIERGTIKFKDKAENCEKAGGIAAVVYNIEGVQSVVTGTLQEDYKGSIPVYGVSRDDGLVLKERNNAWIEIGATVPGYEMKSGTSMAAPHVAGIAARMWAARTQCTRAQIREALEVAALDLGTAGRDDEYGHGLVQAMAAYQYLRDLPPPCGDGSATPNLNDQDGTLVSRFVRKKRSPSSLAKFTMKLGNDGSRCRGGCPVRTRYLKGSGPRRSEMNELDEMDR